MPEAAATPTRLLSPRGRAFAVASHWLNEAEHRLDASTYAEGAFQALDALEACPYEKRPLARVVGKLWHPVQNQARSNFKRIYTHQEYGVPFVGSRDMFAFPLRPRHYLSKRIPKLADLRVPEGWLLVSRSGTIGNVLYVNRHLAACAITEHAIRIEPTALPAGYIYALLASKYGQPIIAKGGFGATVEQVEPRHLAPIPVPIPPERDRDTVYATIHDKIAQAYRLRDEAIDLLDEADKLLHDAIGVAPFTEEDIEYLSSATGSARAFAVPSQGVTDRFDASYYVPIIRSVRDKLDRGRFPLVPLSQRVERIFMPPRFRRIYVEPEHGTPFLQGAQASLIRPYDLKYLSKRANAKEIELGTVQPNWILVTRSGTIGRVTLATLAWNGWVATEDLLRIAPDATKAHPGYVTAFLMTLFGQHQMTAGNYGGVIDHLTEGHLGAVAIPDAPLGLQGTIGERVLAAFAKRDEANTLEDRAIAAIEALIEGLTGPSPLSPSPCH